MERARPRRPGHTGPPNRLAEADTRTLRIFLSVAVEIACCHARLYRDGSSLLPP
jgi:hypothetical protein